jgi:hypothetical protein
MLNHPTAVVLLTVLVCGCARSPKETQAPDSGASRGTNTLEAYLGRDLAQADAQERARFCRQLCAMTGDAPEGWNLSSFDPWWVKEFKTEDVSWMALEVDPERTVPGASGVRAHLFDAQWKRISKCVYSTGYRFFLREADIQHLPLIEGPLLVVRVESAGPFVVHNGSETPAFVASRFQREYYAYRKGSLLLIRLEDDSGKLVANSYRWFHPSIGPPVPRRTTSEWIETLNSADVVETLATLVWLSGHHLESTQPRYENTSQESAEFSRMFEGVRDSAETRSAMIRLKDSANAWVREYAHSYLASPG